MNKLIFNPITIYVSCYVTLAYLVREIMKFKMELSKGYLYSIAIISVILSYHVWNEIKIIDKFKKKEEQFRKKYPLRKAKRTKLQKLIDGLLWID